MRNECLRKIELMHHTFGVGPEGCRCGECSNFVRHFYHTRFYQKCKVYGETNSEASDWAQKYKACGMYNKEWTGNPIINLVRKGATGKAEAPPPAGQTSFFEME